MGLGFSAPEATSEAAGTPSPGITIGMSRSMSLVLRISGSVVADADYVVAMLKRRLGTNEARRVRIALCEGRVESFTHQRAR